MKALGRPGVDVSRLNVEFDIQLPTAEVHAAAGRFSKVEECLPPRVLRHYWNVVVHHYSTTRAATWPSGATGTPATTSAKAPWRQPARPWPPSSLF